MHYRLTVISLIFASVTWAGEGPGEGRRPPPGGPRGGGPGREIGIDPRRWEGIDLSDSQKKKLLDIVTAAFRSSQEAILEGMGRHRTEKPGRGDDHRPADPRGGNRKLAEIQEKMQAEIEAMLTPAQLAQWKKRQDDRPPPGRKEDGDGRSRPRR
ncbi:MAG: hypothetical protein LIP77_03320 [Planctomycetes bacterium]|nr:hypothetical protein [Planctomycetota bacterium]